MSTHKTGVVIATLIAVLALGVAIFGIVQNQARKFGGTTNYDTLDVSDGYLVDGTTVIDGDGNVDAAITSTTGSFSGKLTLNAGLLKSYTNSTSTVVTSYTLVQADILDYDTILFTPNIGDTTLTLPATSTLTSMVPSAGDTQDLCIYNATSTAGIDITLAAGAGMDLERTATSTISGSAGVINIGPRNYACLKFIRETDTDVGVLMTNFVDAD